MFRQQLYRIIFETDTPAGKLFDVALLWAILISVVVVLLESVPAFEARYMDVFFTTEAVLTALFTVEYLLRIYVSPKPSRYIFSSWGFIDLLSILPFYLGLFVTDYHYFLVLRMFRLLRVFRILKLFRFLSEAQFLYLSLRASAYRISVFITGVLMLVILIGTVMYVIEGPESGFTSIPMSIYWTIVTITTVGFGDIVPASAVGKFLASAVMLLGYAIIAIPTGIVTVEMNRRRKETDRQCVRCGHPNQSDANYCSACGRQVEPLYSDRSGKDV